MAIYGTNNPIGYDHKTPQVIFYSEALDENYGAHTDDLKNYYFKSKDWRMYLVKATKEEFDEIILSIVNPTMLKDSPETIEEALKKLRKWLPNTSAKFLREYAETMKHHLADIKPTKDGTKLEWSWSQFPIFSFASTINNAERKLFKKRAIPAFYWEEQRLSLTQEKCDIEGHSARCMVFYGSIYEYPEVMGITSRLGQGKLNWGADEDELRNITMKVNTKLFGKLRLETDDIGKIVEQMNQEKYRFANPYTLLNNEIIQEFEITRDEVNFIKYFVEQYEVEVIDNRVHRKFRTGTR